MFLRKVLGSLRPGSRSGKRSIAPSLRANSVSPLGRRRLRLEPLEDRQMLSITLFVDADSTAQFQDGLDWTHAYTDLQAALTRAAELNADGIANNDVEAIWIAEGTYLPTAELEPGDARSASFSLVDGVSLYGGFAGTETSLDQRDLSICTTILSGDLGVSGDVSDNAYTVVYCGEDIVATLDGVTITGGGAFVNDAEDASHLEKNSGGGIFNSGNLTLRNAEICRNYAISNGGAIYNDNEGQLFLENTSVSQNLAYCGAGIFNDGLLEISSNSNIFGNSAIDSNDSDFGWRNRGEVLLTVISDYMFANGSSWGGLVIAPGWGGGIYNNGIADVFDSTISWNQSVDGGGISNYGQLKIENVIFQENVALNGAGVANYGELEVIASQFQSNVGYFPYYYYLDGGTGKGAGIYNFETGVVDIANSLFANNNGGGMVNCGHMTVVSSTITQNVAVFGGGIATHSESITELYNTIVAGNETGMGSIGLKGDNPDIGGILYDNPEVSGSFIGSNNLIGDGTGLSGLVDGVDGNQIGTAESPIDPGLSITTQEETGLIQYELLSNSPAIDAGDTSLLPADVTDMDGDGDTSEPIPFDIEGADRVQGYSVDIGAYETDADLQVGPILYVDATPSDSDSSWQYVYTDLQSALDRAAVLNSDDIPENDVEAIWIAEGTYRPTISAATVLIDTIPPTSSVTSSSTADASTGTSSGGDSVENTESIDDTPADVSMVTYIPTLEEGIWGRPLYDSARVVCFSLVDGVSLYGGFAGTETSLDERDLSSHETILSGDLGVLGDTSDNAYTVVYCGEDITAGLDGVTVTDGNADALIGTQGKSDGGGIYNLGTLAVANCVISDNTVGESGGGIYNAGVLSVTNSTILNNFAPSKYDYLTPSGGWNICYIYTPCCGGGIYNSGDLTVINSTITGNSAEHGGGICNDNGTLTVTNSTVSDNSSGIYNVGSSAAATLNNTIVAGNIGSDIDVLYSVSVRSSSSSWSGNPFSGSNNLIGKSSADSGLVDGVDGNQVGTADAPVDPMLSELVQFVNGQYGYYPLADSPVIDAGNNDLLSDGVTADIAGNERIYNGTVDIGACESVPVIVTVVDVDDVSLIPEGEVLPVKRTSFTPPTNFSPGKATVPRRSELPPRQLIRPVSELTDVVFAESVSEQALWSSDDLAAIAKEFQMVTVRKTTDESENNPSFALELGLYVDLD